ncbi:MAG: response regulator transcription factor [Chloroflexi bacterium]|nr:response regulator transcription factor [Chloroflexota bacterium]
MTTSPLRVLIADDHALFRRGLISLLNETAEFTVVGEARSGPEAVQLVAQFHPDVVLMDVHMPGGGGLDAVRRLRETMPQLPVIMLTVSENDSDLLQAIRAGAQGYFLKNVDTEELFAGLRRVSSGQAALDSALTGRLFQQLTTLAGADSPLSLRETEILELIAQGRTNREIAAQLVVSENTIKTHVARILEKLGASTRSEAVARAKSHGWLSRL